MSDSGAHDLRELARETRDVQKELRELRRAFNDRGIDALDVTGKMLEKIGAVSADVHDLRKDHKTLVLKVELLEKLMGVDPGVVSLPLRVEALEAAAKAYEDAIREAASRVDLQAPKALEDVQWKRAEIAEWSKFARKYAGLFLMIAAAALALTWGVIEFLPGLFGGG